MNNQNEYTRHEVGDGFFWECKKCKAIIKRQSNLEKHLQTKTHIEHEANTVFWNQRIKKYEKEPFQSLLNPSIRFEREPKVIEWATTKWYNEVYVNMTLDERLEYCHKNDTTTFDIERHHYNMMMGI